MSGIGRGRGGARGRGVGGMLKGIPPYRAKDVVSS